MTCLSHVVAYQLKRATSGLHQVYVCSRGQSKQRARDERDAGARIPSRTHSFGNPFPQDGQQPRAPLRPAGRDSCKRRYENGFSHQQAGRGVVRAPNRMLLASIDDSGVWRRRPPSTASRLPASASLTAAAVANLGPTDHSVRGS